MVGGRSINSGLTPPNSRGSSSDGVKAEIDDNWFLGGLEPTNQLYFVHLLVDGQGREEPGRYGWVEFNWKGDVLPLGSGGTG